MLARLVLVALAALVSAPAGAQHAEQASGPHARRHLNRSAAEWKTMLERKEREAWQKPDEVVRALKLSSGDAAADIGAGTGYFSVRLARAVGPDGKVYAVDIQEDLIDHLTERARREKLDNLTAVLAAHDDPKLGAGSVDLVFICDVVHHIENRQDYYAKLARALRPGGRAAIVDFFKRADTGGPPLAMKIAKQDMIAEWEQAGFKLVEDIDLLERQYFLVFSRP